MLAWSEPQGCCEFAPLRERFAITQGTGKSAGGKWTDTAQF